MVISIWLAALMFLTWISAMYPTEIVDGHFASGLIVSALMLGAAKLLVMIFDLE